MAKKKYYVVWVGSNPGIYESWAECKAQVVNYPKAKYKSFKSRAEAEKAFAEAYTENRRTRHSYKPPASIAEIDMEAIAVDAACSGNPGDMEYRGVWVKDKAEIFHMGPLSMGTNNVGEFLAIVHALALLKQLGNNKTQIYTDSKIAMGWVKKGKANTKLKKTRRNVTLFNLIARAEKWLAQNQWDNPITKWKTKEWGEIPADFGRK